MTSLQNNVDSTVGHVRPVMLPSWGFVGIPGVVMLVTALYHRIHSEKRWVRLDGLRRVSHALKYTENVYVEVKEILALHYARCVGLCWILT